MAEARKPTGAAASRTGARGTTRELLDNTFLLRFARLNITSSEQFQLGVSLKMKGSTVRDITRDSDDAVSNTYLILEAWLDSRTNDGNSTEWFDELSAACLNISRCDLLDFVRCEQIRQMAENTRKSKESWRSQKKNFNEQMLLAKQELQTTRALLQQETTLLNNSKASLQQECAELMKTKAALQQARADLDKLKAHPETSNVNPRATAAGATAASGATAGATAVKSQVPVKEMVKRLRDAAKPVAGESWEDESLRALRVMAMLWEDGRAELWLHVSDYFMRDGVLDLQEELTTCNLPHLIFLLSSHAADHITWLRLNNNPVLGEGEAERTLGTALGRGFLTGLEALSLIDCQLNDTSLGHVVDGIISGCPRLTSLWLTEDKTTDASADTLRRLLRRVPGLRITWCLSRPSWSSQLLAEFPGRIH